MSNDLKKKNKYDLDYNKYCQLFNTSIVVFSTLFVGVFLALSTEQLKITGPNFSLIISTLLLITIGSLFFAITSHNNMEEIKRRIDKLNI